MCRRKEAWWRLGGEGKGKDEGAGIGSRESQAQRGARSVWEQERKGVRRIDADARRAIPVTPALS